MTLNKLIKELEKCRDKRSKSFYCSIDHLADEIYKHLKNYQEADCVNS